MTAYRTPGVYVNEGTLSTLNASPRGGTSAVFFGEAERGPSAATLINDWPTYRSLYGDLKNEYDLGYSVYHYFANGGRSCYVVRVVAGQTGTEAADADTGANGVPFYPRGYLSANAVASITDVAVATNVATITCDAAVSFVVGDSVTVADLTTTALNGTHTITGVSGSTFTFAITTADVAETPDTGTATVTAASRVAKAFDAAAANVGAWGNGLTVTLAPGAVDPSATSHGTFSVVVALDGVEVERWVEMSLNPNDSRYVQTVINTYSKFVTVSNVSTAAGTGLTDWNSTANSLSTTFTGGDSGTVVGLDRTAAHARISGILGNLILNHVGVTDSTVIGNLITVAETRGDSFVVIDPDAADEADADVLTAISTTAQSLNTTSSYAAQYVPRLKMIDPAKSGPGAIRDTHPGGAVAGVMVRTETQGTPAKAPAGYGAEIRGALGLTVPMSNDAIGDLYSNNPAINSFKSVSGAGVVVYGARTFARTNPGKFIPVRRTLNYLKYSLKEITEFAVFQPNDPRLWGKITSVVDSFLADFYRKGGLKGENTGQAFYVRCNSTNNSVADADQGVVNVEVGVALTYPAEFIVINLSQWSGGSNTADTL